ncbi:MAG TPA: SPOR domain-containing protein [Bacteroidales bacterium]|nr:SPOR domain-containing protein [Bacteroidales bacterium]HSA43429.1 SPOR domain-containing protein [Bacteroidales bacterium]
MDVSKYIHELLTEKGEVSVPGLGRFTGTSRAATPDSLKTLLHPPGIQYAFEAGPAPADTLAKHCSARENLPLSLAIKEIEEYVDGCHFVINKGKRLEIPGVGLLFNDPQGKICFEADPGLETSGDYYGLQSVGLHPIKKSSGYRTAKIIMVILMAGALVFAGFYAASIASFLRQRLSFPGKETPAQQSETAPTPSDPSLTMPDTAVLLHDTAFTGNDTTSVHDLPPPAINPEENPSTLPQYYIVAGCFRLEEGATKTVEKLVKEGYPARIFARNSQGLHMVCYDSYTVKADALKTLHQIRTAKDPNAWLIRQ